jgi:hypothetical protein
MAILDPSGKPTGGESERPSNKRILGFIKDQVAMQEADKIVDLAQEKQNLETTERRRKQLTTAVAIVMQQMNEDAKLMEAFAREPSTKLQEAHDKMELARSMRVAMGYLQGLVVVQNEAATGSDAHGGYVVQDKAPDSV